VTARRDDLANGRVPLFFARVLGHTSYAQSVSAVAMGNPRDIVFVVDLSGSMNDDTEPGWATDELNVTFDGFAGIGDDLMQDVFEDFGYGTYPGASQHIGQPLGVTQDSSAYYNLTKDGGLLSAAAIPAAYRILSGDSAASRKQKSYQWIIDTQIALLMPGVTPAATSANYNYWSRYLDYVIYATTSSPPSQYAYRIDSLNNPNPATFPDMSSSVPRGFRNKIGYRTYVQFMMDHGRDVRPDGSNYTPLSRSSPHCPYHSETTAGGTFQFPPREQPAHASRRALIAAIQVVKEKNQSISDLTQRDWVSVVTYDHLASGGPVVLQPLTGDYDVAMQACTTMQCVADNQSSTATEAGIIEARNHAKPASQGGSGRTATNKVVVLLTDGVPNLYESSNSTVSSYRTANDSDDWYGGSAYAKDAPLMQAMQMTDSNWYLYPVGLGLGTDYSFLDRLARQGDTADDGGQSPRGSGNPADYEQRMTEIFTNIITCPKVRLVQ